MKKILTLIIVYLISGTSYLQISPIEDVTHVKPEKGVLRTEVTKTEQGSNTSYLSKVTYYNDDGYEVQSIELNLKGDTTEKSFTTYLENGLELTVAYDKGRVDSIFEKYNNKNLLEYDIYLFGSKHPATKDSTIYTYDESGNLITINEVHWKYKEIYKYKGNKLISVTAIDADVDIEDGERPEIYVSDTYKYLNGGKKVENNSWIGKNEFYSKTHYTLNEKGMPVLIEVYDHKDKGGTELSYKRVSIYYDNGSLKHETIERFKSNKRISLYTFEYNDRGSFIKQIYADESDRETILEYKYYYK